MADGTTPEPIQQLRAHLATIADLRAAAAVLRWDQETYMPPAGAAGRAEQLGTLMRLAHELLVSPRTRELLAAAEAVLDRLDPDSDDARIVVMTRRDYDRASRLPPEFVAARARHASASVQIWREARRRNDFPAFRPALAQMVELVRREADYLGYAEHPYDALLDHYEPGMTSRQVEALFARLREATVPLVRAIARRGAPDDSFLYGEFDIQQQRAFGLEVAQAFGYDLRRGRLDESTHPFATAFHPDDVRITTRYSRYLPSALFAIFHEAGHALYEQGIPPQLARTCLGRGASLGFHESQSRLWENLVGRSRPFWAHYYPRLLELFPSLRGVDLDRFYRAVNRVQPSLIRVEADEVTYNLHIMLRFDLERHLVEGTLAAEELPDAWREKMQAYLGITPPSDAEGVLQDIHWASGSVGYFPTYTLGNVISVQLYEAARRDHPGLPEDIGRGQFGTLLGWLRDRVHRHGRKYLPADLLRRATGSDLTPDPYLRYLDSKFGEIYGLGIGQTARRP
ncbi:MAG: carboxypeptidase M32 [Armatimonadota bacterium]|nr:carboxypeptidase M32 [Armatimonadota bacterium]MDR7611181.1 carboxypeptidase M32 [Armatimonadota bacterium]